MISKIIMVSLLALASATPIHSPIEYIGKFPYHVSVRDAGGRHICSGAIIKSNVVLAPGTCMREGRADHIVAGSVDPTDNDANFTQTIKIVRVERNIGFFGEKFMELFFLDNALRFGYGVEPIKISKTDPSERNDARITGFSVVGGEHKLRSIDLKVSRYNQCKAFINHPVYNEVVMCTVTRSKTDVCNAYEETSLLACRGKEIELCGVALSHRNFVCNVNQTVSEHHIFKNNADYLAVFVKLSAFRDWLEYFDL